MNTQQGNMQLIYSVIFLFLSALLEVLWFGLYPLLFVFLSKASRKERLGIDYPTEHFDLLIHAASVGEINGAKPLLLKIAEQFPGIRILLTVNTETGRKTGRNLHPGIHCIISPLDVLHLRLMQLKHTKPRLIMIIETEIWPEQLYAARLGSIPVVFVNARISQKTLNRYLQVKPLITLISSGIKLICTQSEEDSQRFQLLFGEAKAGLAKCSVDVSHKHKDKCSTRMEILTCGNLKYAVQLPDYNGGELRTEMGYSETDKLIVVGSSRPGEEALLLNCFDALISEFPDLKLIIAPRHLNRMDEIRSLMQSRDVSFYSTDSKAKPIHIIDELGHLLPAYAMADIAIIGGSYFPFGGHNPLEAAYYSKTIMMGRHHESCLESVSSLLVNNAIIINDSSGIVADLRDILTNPAKYNEQGNRAKTVMNEKCLSLDKHFEQIRKYIV